MTPRSPRSANPAWSEPTMEGWRSGRAGGGGARGGGAPPEAIPPNSQRSSFRTAFRRDRWGYFPRAGCCMCSAKPLAYRASYSFSSHLRFKQTPRNGKMQKVAFLKSGFDFATHNHGPRSNKCCRHFRLLLVQIGMLLCLPHPKTQDAWVVPICGGVRGGCLIFVSGY